MRLFVLLGVLLLAGCGAREEVVVSNLSVAHRSWDSLEVSVAFASKSTLGGLKSVAVSSRSIVAYNTSYDTLYAGVDSVFAISDIDLGNRERILVEVCGEVKQLIVCEQATTLASPKRISLEPDIEYPLRKKVFEGEYTLPFLVERQSEEGWEEIAPSGSIQGYLKAYVQGQEDEFIRVPFSSHRGGFNLANLGNYKDFKYYLDVALMREKAANVVFDVFVDLEGVEQAVASVEKAIEMKTEDEHKQDIALYAEQAADRIVDHLSPFLRREKNTVYIDRWSYNPFKKMYSVEMEVEWRGTLFNRSTYRLAGVLEVYESGDRGSFRYVEGNRRASQRWESRVDGTVLDLFATSDVPDESIGQELGPHREQDGLLVLEAEHYATSRTYNRQSWGVSRGRSGFIGTGAVVVAPDEGVRIRSRYNKRSPELTYPVRFTEAGEYYIWVRVWATDDGSNSLHLGLNGDAQRSASYIGTEIYNQWIWTRKQLDSDDYASITVPGPGMRDINLWMREDGVYVDRIILTKDRYFAPSAEGPAESLR